LPKPTSDEIAEIRAAVREGHELLRDLNLAIREAKNLLKDFPQAAIDKIDEGVIKGLEHFQNELGIAIEQATAGVFRRFDTIAAICLGEDPQSVAEGKRTLESIIQDMQARENAVKAFGLSPRDPPVGGRNEDPES
jgi:hypothetical protein